MAMYALRYASTRREIWRWYWRAWARPTGLWRFHVLFGVFVALVITASDKSSDLDWPLFLVRSGVCTACFVALLPLWPQIRFKPQVRTLEVDAKGFRTS